MKKRIMIITPYGIFNYGNRLQNHAVQMIFKSRGFDCDTILINGITWKNSWKDRLKPVLWKIKKQDPRAIKYHAFCDFDRMVSKRVVQAAQLPKVFESEYDVVAIGGDQIWNPNYIKQISSVYGAFAPGSRRLCISPSFGVDKLSEDDAANIAEWLLQIKNICVREKTGSVIVKELTGRDCPVHLDPTLVLGVEYWDRIASGAMNVPNPYVFVYLLGSERKTVSDAVRNLADVRGFNVVELMNLDHPEFYGSGPAEFVELIRGSSDVITDSFHAMAFAIIYGIPVHLVVREGDAFTMSSRFSTLADLSGLDVKSLRWDWSSLGKTDYDASSAHYKITEAKRRFSEYLDLSLGEILDV